MSIKRYGKMCGEERGARNLELGESSQGRIGKTGKGEETKRKSGCGKAVKPS